MAAMPEPGLHITAVQIEPAGTFDKREIVGGFAAAVVDAGARPRSGRIERAEACREGENAAERTSAGIAQRKAAGAIDGRAGPHPVIADHGSRRTVAATTGAIATGSSSADEIDSAGQYGRSGDAIVIPGEIRLPERILDRRDRRGLGPGA
jgi:hypothetical protein